MKKGIFGQLVPTCEGDSFISMRILRTYMGVIPPQILEIDIQKYK